MHTCLTLGLRNSSVLHPTPLVHCLQPWCGRRHVFLLLLPGCGLWVVQLCSCRQCVKAPLRASLPHFCLTVKASDLSVHPGKLLIKPGLTQVPSWRGIWICSEEGCSSLFKFCVPTYSPQTAQTDRAQVIHCACCAYFLLHFPRENRLKLVLSFPLVPPITENY